MRMTRSRLARDGAVPPAFAFEEKPLGNRGEGDAALGVGLDEVGVGCDVESVVGDPVGATGLGLAAAVPVPGWAAMCRPTG